MRFYSLRVLQVRMHREGAKQRYTVYQNKLACNARSSAEIPHFARVNPSYERVDGPPKLEVTPELYRKDCATECNF